MTALICISKALHIFSNTCFFSFGNSHSQICEVILHCGFDITFPWWLVHVELLFMFLLVAYSLWRNFCSFLCPFFNEIVLFFWLSCMDSSYIMYFEYYLPYEIDDSILLLRLPFHLVDSFLYCTALRFHLFSLVFVLAFNPKNHCPNQLTLTFFS